MSNSALANKINVTPQTISNIITERTKPSLDTLEKIAHVLNVEVRELFFKKTIATSKKEIIEEIEVRLKRLKEL